MSSVACSIRIATLYTTCASASGASSKLEYSSFRHALRVLSFSTSKSMFTGLSDLAGASAGATGSAAAAAAGSALGLSFALLSRRCFSTCAFHVFTSSLARSEMRASACVRSLPTATPILVAYVSRTTYPNQLLGRLDHLFELLEERQHILRLAVARSFRELLVQLFGLFHTRRHGRRKRARRAGEISRSTRTAAKRHGTGCTSATEGRRAG